MIAEGGEFQVIKGRLDVIAPVCSDLKSKGYRVVKIKRKILWPFFWIRIYKVKMKRDFIIDFESEEMIFTPIDELKS